MNNKRIAHGTVVGPLDPNRTLPVLRTHRNIGLVTHLAVANALKLQFARLAAAG